MYINILSQSGSGTHLVVAQNSLGVVYKCTFNVYTMSAAAAAPHTMFVISAPVA